MKQNKTAKQLAFDLNKDSKKIEKDYLAKRRRHQKEKNEQEELSQQWLAPLLLVLTLLIGYLLYTFY
jgi:Holliday junction resolvasome RuvABC DNA-binding subunit